MLEVEQASINSEAQARLAQIRSQLGLGPGTEAPSDAPADGQTAEGAAGTPGETPSPGA
jgi:hypothetical protein